MFPTNSAPIVFNRDGNLIAEQIKWGFPRYNASGVLINARAETLLDRPTFRKSAIERRCLVPAHNFYEWDKSKVKLSFARTDSPVLYMAGIYNTFKGEPRFTIITTAANSSVSPIHDRMPLILEKNELENWIYDDNALEYILHKTPVLLEYH